MSKSLKRVIAALDAAGIDIPFPTRTVLTQPDGDAAQTDRSA